MAGIVYDARRIKAYEGLRILGEIADETKEWCDTLCVGRQSGMK